MSQRIDIELTSAGEGQWTWRAAGARQPKGLLDVSLLYPGVRVGDVVRAEMERLIDGVTILSVAAPKSAKARPETLAIIAKAEPEYPTVNVQYAEKGGRGRNDRDGGRGGPRPDRGPRDGARPTRDGADRGPRPERGPRPDRPERPRVERAPRPERPARPTVERGPKRFAPRRIHRDALINDLPVEERPVAEQLLRGGIPAVRQAIIDQNAGLKAAGGIEIPAAPLLAMADRLLARVKQAEWLDKAQAALDAPDISLRDLRQVVTQADGVARDDSSREMAAKLREELAKRVENQRDIWAADIVKSIEEGKLVRGVRAAGNIPDPAAKLAPEVTARLVAATNAELSSETPAERWLALVEAAADSPFRRDVVPTGLPTKTNEAFLAAAAQASNRIPALLKLLGISIPPPPRAKSAGRPVPPPPPVRAALPVAAVAPVVEVAVSSVAEVAVSSVAEVAAAPVVAEAAPAVEVAPVTEVVPVVVEAPVVEAPVVEAPVAEAAVAEPTE